MNIFDFILAKWTMAEPWGALEWVTHPSGPWAGAACSLWAARALPRAAGKCPTISKDIFGFPSSLAVRLCVFFQRQAGFKMEEGDNGDDKKARAI